jgi:hypothetical protein
MKIILLLGIVAIFFVSLYVLYYTPYGAVKKTLLKTNINEKIIKEYLQEKVNFEIPKEYELIEIVMKNGKDKILVIRGVLRCSIEQFLFLLGNDYKKTECNKDDIVFSLTKNSNQQYKDIYKLTKQEKNLLIEIVVAQTNFSNEYIVYFHFIDNRFPHYNIFECR